jgi:hypothetical protein
MFENNQFTGKSGLENIMKCRNGSNTNWELYKVNKNYLVVLVLLVFSFSNLIMLPFFIFLVEVKTTVSPPCRPESIR